MTRKELENMLKEPEKHIPSGIYCYKKVDDTMVPCPFWDLKPKDYPINECGYCHFLKKSDWEINEEYENTHINVVNRNGFKWDGEEYDEITNKKEHFTHSLIFDMVKECDVNRKPNINNSSTKSLFPIPSITINI